MKLIQIFYKILCVSTMYMGQLIYTMIFKCFLTINRVRFGKGLRTFNAIPDLVISINACKVILGDYVMFNNYTDQSWNTKCKIYVREGASLTIGNHSGMNGTLIFCAERIDIGDYVNVGGGTRISDSNHHNLDWRKRRDPKTNSIAKTDSIVIEDDVFIGANCYIGKGITIGARSIIAAGSVVVNDIPPEEIWGGNPAKKIKSLSI